MEEDSSSERSESDPPRRLVTATSLSKQRRGLAEKRTASVDDHALARPSRSASLSAQVPRMQLVLDIDQTLLHASEAPAGSEAQPADGVHSFMLPRPNGGMMSRYHVRTRHGLHSFLRELEAFADVHIYTMASKSYVREVLDAIDPDIKLIAGRVFCREDGQPDTFLKSLTHLQSNTDVSSIRAQQMIILRELNLWQWQGFSWFLRLRLTNLKPAHAYLSDPFF